MNWIVEIEKKESQKGNVYYQMTVYYENKEKTVRVPIGEPSFLNEKDLSLLKLTGYNYDTK